MSSTDSGLITRLSDVPILLHRYVIPILLVLGNLGNGISISIFLKRSWRKKVCSFYFVVCLLCNTMLLNSSIIGSILVTGYHVNIQNSNRVLCKLFYFTSYFFSPLYPIILILASIDRLLISSQNVDTRLYSSKRLAYFSISTSVTVWFLFSLHILIKVDIRQIDPSISICYYELSKSYLDFFLYSSVFISVSIPAVMVILSILSFKNVRRIRTVPRQQRKEIRSMTRKDFQLLRCLYAHSVVYILCSLPISFSIVRSTTVRYQNRTPLEQAVDTFLNDVGAFLHYFPYCTSFFIFVSMSKAFRYELKRWAYLICSKDPATIQTGGDDENNHQPQDVGGETIDIPSAVVCNSILPAS